MICMITINGRYLSNADNPTAKTHRENFTEVFYVIDLQNNQTYWAQLDNTSHNELATHGQYQRHPKTKEPYPSILPHPFRFYHGGLPSFQTFMNNATEKWPV